MAWTFDEVGNFIVKKTTLKSKKIIKDAVTLLTQDIIDNTPVDTSRLKNNYFVGTKHSNYSTNEKGATNRAKNLIFNLGDTIYIENNLAYAKRIEFGHSKQAPKGMMRIAAAKWRFFVNEAKKNVRD